MGSPFPTALVAGPEDPTARRGEGPKAPPSSARETDRRVVAPLAETAKRPDSTLTGLAAFLSLFPFGNQRSVTRTRCRSEALEGDIVGLRLEGFFESLAVFELRILRSVHRARQGFDLRELLRVVLDLDAGRCAEE